MAGHQAPTLLQLGCCSNATADTSILELARISSESNLMRDEEHGPLITRYCLGPGWNGLSRLFRDPERLRPLPPHSSQPSIACLAASLYVVTPMAVSQRVHGHLLHPRTLGLRKHFSAGTCRLTSVPPHLGGHHQTKILQCHLCTERDRLRWSHNHLDPSLLQHLTQTQYDTNNGGID